MKTFVSSVVVVVAILLVSGQAFAEIRRLPTEPIIGPDPVDEPIAPVDKPLPNDAKLTGKDKAMDVQNKEKELPNGMKLEKRDGQPGYHVIKETADMGKTGKGHKGHKGHGKIASPNPDPTPDPLPLPGDIVKDGPAPSLSPSHSPVEPGKASRPMMK